MTNLSDTLAALSEAGSTAKYWLEHSCRTDLAADQREALETLTALVNAYRTGQLVPVPSVEAVARAIVRTNTEQRVRRDPQLTDEERSDIVECQVHNGWDLWVPEATAVIAAMQEGRE